MDERRNEIRPREPETIYREERVPTEAERGYPPREPDIRPEAREFYDRERERREKSTDEIERDIERTRAHMSRTINEIELRLSPKHIKQRFKDEMKHTVRGASSSVVDVVRDNPVPALMASIGLGWLVMKARESSSQRRSYYSTGYAHGVYPEWDEYRGGGYRDVMYGEPSYYGGEYIYPDEYASDQDEYRREAYRSRSDQARERAEHFKNRASEAVGQRRQQAEHIADEARERVSELGHEARERMSEMSHGVQRQAYRAQSQIEQLMDENPLAAGAIALGIGAAIGMMFPGTRMEDEFMGRKRDKFVSEAKETAEDTFEQVKEVASQSAEKVKEEVKHAAENVKHTTRQEAERVKDETRQQMQNQQSGSEKGKEYTSTTPGGRQDQGSKPI